MTWGEKTTEFTVDFGEHLSNFNFKHFRSCCKLCFVFRSATGLRETGDGRGCDDVCSRSHTHPIVRTIPSRSKIAEKVINRKRATLNSDG